MSHYNYGIINGANESAPKLGAYVPSPTTTHNSFDISVVYIAVHSGSAILVQEAQDDITVINKPFICFITITPMLLMHSH